MNIQLVSCGQVRPDKRAIQKMLQELAGIDSGTAFEMTDILLDGDPIDIEVDDKSTSSVFRTLRKLEIEYELE